MKLIGTKTHGYLDYIVGALLIASPWIFGFDDGSAAQWIPVFLGAGAIFYSLLTDYEMGASPQISMRTHLTLDMASGLLLALSPWVFGFADLVWQPHLLFGILEIGVALMTRMVPSTERAHQGHRHRAAH